MTDAERVGAEEESPPPISNEFDAERRKEALLSESVVLLQATIESTADGILVVDLKGNLQLFNHKFGELWRIPRELIENRQEELLFLFVLGQLTDSEGFMKRVREIYADLEGESSDTLHFKDGRVFERFSKPLWRAQKAVGRVWCFRDVTDLVRAERALKESEEKFRALSEATFEGVFIHDQGKILLANKSATDLYGYSFSELVEMTGVQLAAPESRDLVQKIANTNTSSGTFEAAARRKDGSTFWAEFRARPMRYRGIPARVATVHDVTERKNIEQKLQQVAEEFRAAFEVAAVGNAQVDPLSIRITRANNKLSEITGYSRNELLSMQFLEMIHPDDRITAYDAFQEMIRGKIDQYSAERRSIRKDGRPIWITVSVALSRDLNGKPVKAILVVQDITDRKMAEQERDRLLKAETRAREQATFLAEAGKVLASSLDYTETLKNVATLIVSHLADWCILSLGKENGQLRAVAIAADPPRTELICGLEAYCPNMSAPNGLPRAVRTRSAVLYSEVSDEQLDPNSSGWPIVGTRDPDVLETMRTLGMKSYMAIPIFVRNQPVGGILIASAKVEHLYDESDLNLATELARMCATAIDNATLYQEAQRSIVVRDDFISIASHELKTPLTPLKLQIQLLKRHFRSPEMPRSRGSLSELLNDSEQQVDRLIKLVENLLDVTRISAGRLVFSFEEGVDLGKLVAGTLKRFSAEIEAAGCEIHFASDPAVKGRWDRLRVEQVVTNLISNAIKYGRLKPVDVRVTQEGDYALLTVTDHGVGIDPKQRDKLFGRFQRVASLTHFGGLGLGLFISRQIVEGHRGSINVESVPGQWTTFRVQLPTEV